MARTYLIIGDYKPAQAAYFKPDAIGTGFLNVADDSGTEGKIFTGIAVDELYLMRAEGYAREGNVELAVSDINTLLSTRYKTNSYKPYITNSADDALAKVLAERRKELVQRGLRWSDLRRLNQDKRFAITLSRTLLGITYTLNPKDNRYTLQIPEYIIAASHGSITQNP